MKKQININDLIFEKIKFRYHFFSSTRNTTPRTNGKIIIDSLYPSEIARTIMNQDGYRPDSYGYKRGYAISERVAIDLDSRKLHISELVTMLGYTKTDISKILQTVKNKKFSIILVGLGGTGSNFLHWMYEMTQWVGKTEIFQTLEGYDDDDFDIPNMLRIPFIPQFNSKSKSAKKANTIPNKFRNLASQYIIKAERLTIPTKRRNSFVYGAPDIKTREVLSKSGIPFFAATHRDNEYSIVENPDVDNDLMMETYGKINLAMFFLNHLSMTIDFMKHLEQREETMEVNRKNTTVTREDFMSKYSRQVSDGFKAGSKKLFVPHGARTIEDLNVEIGV